ncbi:hypothetical protein D3C72_430140 [compost metagenome]
MTVALHVDGGVGVGLGHAMRGIGLASALREIGLNPVFFVSEASDLRPILEPFKVRVETCDPTPAGLVSVCSKHQADVLIVDSYRLTEAHLRELSQGVRSIICFDDKADRVLDVALVVNGAPSAGKLDYRVGTSTVLLLGTPYQIVRPEFIEPVEKHYHREPRSILVTVGGDDVLNIMGDLLAMFEELLAQRWSQVTVNFVVGPYFDTARPPRDPRCVIHRAPRDIRRLMCEADLCLSAGGQTLYELARCGTPTIAFCVGDDQVPNLEAFSDYQGIMYVGWAKQTGWLDRVLHKLERLLSSGQRRALLGRRASELIDGQGARRVAARIQELITAQA